ncbi:hypothetical protein CTAYLR_005326 [Chrysophaeum taylorii]|uniref:J domain-containing protein n=1 Tax=Chrysophaeum taylorii TaxID=2483200 RepID=A0AAD7XKB0_9STRA|nr:hypothetical protein CTAYLR_005326 [Chrysophaeum taylorii]
MPQPTAHVVPETSDAPPGRMTRPAQGSSGGLEPSAAPPMSPPSPGRADGPLPQPVTCEIPPVAMPKPLDSAGSRPKPAASADAPPTTRQTTTTTERGPANHDDRNAGKVQDGSKQAQSTRVHAEPKRRTTDENFVDLTLDNDDDDNNDLALDDDDDDVVEKETRSVAGESSFHETLAGSEDTALPKKRKISFDEEQRPKVRSRANSGDNSEPSIRARKDRPETGDEVRRAAAPDSAQSTTAAAPMGVTNSPKAATPGASASAPIDVTKDDEAEPRKTASTATPSAQSAPNVPSRGPTRPHHPRPSVVPPQAGANSREPAPRRTPHLFQRPLWSSYAADVDCERTSYTADLDSELNRNALEQERLLEASRRRFMRDKRPAPPRPPPPMPPPPVVVSRWQSHNPYVVLGVPQNANFTTCRKAWLRLALKHHPDKSNSPDSRVAFDAISKAYQAVSTTSTTIL